MVINKSSALEFIEGIAFGSDAIYALRKPVRLRYLDWQGAGAAVIFDNPLFDVADPSTTHSAIDMFPPHLEDGDVSVYAHELMYALADRYHDLRSRNEVRGQDQKDLKTLARLFREA